VSLAERFNPGWFEHAAIYNEAEGRIEMHLRASKAHRVAVAGRSFAFRAGETIHTEKLLQIHGGRLPSACGAGGWQPLKAWTGRAKLFSLAPARVRTASPDCGPIAASS